MGKTNVFQFFHTEYKQVSRPQREELMCAMIRINYGTPWQGDLDRLQDFFPHWYHKNLCLGGLTDLIETLSPFTDDVTESGIKAPQIASQEEFSEVTSSYNEELTTDLPTIKVYLSELED